MLSILHISDLHFGPPFVPAVGEAALRAAGALAPDIIVASGDFTQRAKRKQYDQARAYLDRLPRVPLVVTPGNHDVPVYRVFERLFRPYALYRQYISQELDSVLMRDDVAIVSLNTTSPLWAITNGRIDRWQLDFCARRWPKRLRRLYESSWRITISPAPDYDDENDVMWRAREALDRFNELGVELILGGHLHRGYIGNSLDVYRSKTPGSGIIVVQSGTTTSRRGRAQEREKNSFNLVQIGPDVTLVTHFMYFHEVEGFAPISRHTFPRRHRHYLDTHVAGEP